MNCYEFYWFSPFILTTATLPFIPVFTKMEAFPPPSPVSIMLTERNINITFWC